MNFVRLYNHKIGEVESGLTIHLAPILGRVEGILGVDGRRLASVTCSKINVLKNHIVRVGVTLRKHQDVIRLDVVVSTGRHQQRVLISQVNETYVSRYGFEASSVGDIPWMKANP